MLSNTTLSHKTLAVSLLVSSCVSLSACNKPAQTTPADPKANTANSAPTTTSSNKPNNPNQPTYKVSITGETPPFVFMDEKGQNQGLDIELIQKIGELEDFNVEFTTSNWNGMFTAIDSGKSDLAISGISYTPDRNAKYALSQSYLHNPSAIAYDTAKVKFQTLDDLKGQPIAAADGGKSLTYAQSVKDGKVSIQKSSYLMLQQVMQGQAVGAIYDQPVLNYLVKKHPEYKVTIAPLDKADDPTTQTVILMAKSKPELLTKVNDGLSQLEKSGELAKLKTKWGVN